MFQVETSTIFFFFPHNYQIFFPYVICASALFLIIDVGLYSLK